MGEQGLLNNNMHSTLASSPDAYRQQNTGYQNTPNQNYNYSPQPTPQYGSPDYNRQSSYHGSAYNYDAS
jgi:hypothetical protein